MVGEVEVGRGHRRGHYRGGDGRLYGWDYPAEYFPALDAPDLQEAREIIEALRAQESTIDSLRGRAERLHLRVMGTPIVMVPENVLGDFQQYLSTNGAGDKAFDVVTSSPVTAAVSAIPIFGWIFGAAAAIARPIKAAVDAATGHDPTGQRAAQEAAAAAAAAKEKAERARKRAAEKQLYSDTVKLTRKEERALVQSRRSLDLQAQAATEVKKYALEAKRIADDVLEEEQSERKYTIGVLVGAGLTVVLAGLYAFLRLKKKH